MFERVLNTSLETPFPPLNLCETQKIACYSKGSERNNILYVRRYAFFQGVEEGCIGNEWVKASVGFSEALDPGSVLSCQIYSDGYIID